MEVLLKSMVGQIFIKVVREGCEGFNLECNSFEALVPSACYWERSVGYGLFQLVWELGLLLLRFSRSFDCDIVEVVLLGQVSLFVWLALFAQAFGSLSYAPAVLWDAFLALFGLMIFFPLSIKQIKTNLLNYT